MSKTYKDPPLDDHAGTAYPERFQSRFFIICLVLATLLLATVLKPLWSTIFWAVVSSITFLPLHKFILKRMHGRRNVSALLSTLLTVLCVIIPIIATFGVAANELLQYLDQFLQKEGSNGSNMGKQLIDTFPFIEKYLGKLGISTESIISQVNSSMETLGSKAASATIPLSTGVMLFLFHFALMCYLLFFLFRDGHEMLKNLLKNLPMKDDVCSPLVTKFNAVVQATMRGNFVVAAIQGAMGGILFAVLGIPSALLFGVLMTMAALVPLTGCALIWFPVALYQLYIGETVTGIVILAFGALAVSLIDNILRPILVGRDTKLPDYVVLFTTFGGLTFYGAEGFVLGPLFAALVIVFWEVFAEHYLPSR